jgi:hypothetical protein
VPDLDALRRLPRHAPPHGGLAEVTARARRRQRRAAAGGAGALALSAVVLIALGGTAGTDSLRQTDIGVAGTSPRPATSATGGAPFASARPAVPAATPHPGRPAATTDAGGSTAGGSPAPAAARQAASQAMRRAYSHDPVGGTVCGGIVSDPAASDGQKLCGGVDAATATRGYADFAVTGCLDRAATNDATLTFASDREADVALYRDGKRVWLWSAGRTFRRRAHSLPLTAGDCYTWTTSWRTTDAAGRALPRGDYEVRGTIAAAELGSDNAWTTTLTL